MTSDHGSGVVNTRFLALNTSQEQPTHRTLRLPPCPARHFSAVLILWLKLLISLQVECRSNANSNQSIEQLAMRCTYFANDLVASMSYRRE